MFSHAIYFFIGNSAVFTFYTSSDVKINKHTGPHFKELPISFKKYLNRFLYSENVSTNKLRRVEFSELFWIRSKHTNILLCYVGKGGSLGGRYLTISKYQNRKIMKQERFVYLLSDISSSKSYRYK